MPIIPSIKVQDMVKEEKLKIDNTARNANAVISINNLDDLAKLKKFQEDN